MSPWPGAFAVMLALAFVGMCIAIAVHWVRKRKASLNEAYYDTDSRLEEIQR